MNCFRIITAIFSAIMGIGYLVCAWAGLTGKISWLQATGPTPRYGGHQFLTVGTICYFFLILGIYLLYPTFLKKILNKKPFQVLFFIPIIILAVLSLYRVLFL